MLTTILFILLCILQINDVGTTYYALKHHIGKEANGFMRWFMRVFGVLPALIAVKVLLMIAMLSVWDVWVIGVLCAVYVLVAINNFRIINNK